MTADFEIMAIPSSVSCSICRRDARVYIRLIGTGLAARPACADFPAHQDWVKCDLLRAAGRTAQEASQ